jgi:sensor histidine kinase YesM
MNIYSVPASWRIPVQYAAAHTLLWNAIYQVWLRLGYLVHIQSSLVSILASNMIANTSKTGMNLQKPECIACEKSIINHQSSND